MSTQPPEGWSRFGEHVDIFTGDDESQTLQFSNETGPDGVPLWERVIPIPPAEAMASTTEECGLCHRPAIGFATVDDVRYCHGDFESPSCYMQKVASSFGRIFAGLDEKSVQRILWFARAVHKNGQQITNLQILTSLPPLDPELSVATYAQIAEHLLVVINRGDLKPGDKLPSEFDLVSHYGVTRETVRSALRVLERGGLIFTQAGRGTFVRATGADVV